MKNFITNKQITYNKFIKFIKTSIVAVILAIPVAATYGQFTLTGEIRPRTEYRHGYKALADSAQDAAFFTDQRTRLNLNYKDENFKVGITIQDVRTWGSQKQLNVADGLISIHQAWAEVLFSDKFSLKAGRQELVYDDHRIFGDVGWVQQARSHDLALFKYNGFIKAHLGLAYNQDESASAGNFYTVANYKVMQFLWLHKSFDSLNTKVGFLFLNNGLQGTKITQIDSLNYDTTNQVNFSQTIGPRISYKKDKLAANGAFYYQMGKGGKGAGQNISAYDLQLDVSYKIIDKLTLTAGFELLSGTSQTDTSNKVNNSFTPFYGTNHKFNGYMDYFYVGNHIGSVGLQDIFFKAKYKTNKYFLGADLHFFSAAADILDSKELANSGKYTAMKVGLGTEIDLTAGYIIAKSVVLKAGYSQMFGTNSLVALKGGKTNVISNWGWVMLVVNPHFKI
ncbi:MAG: hypothetical protein FVQ77_02165 [Cytophagales bacterium]|nr:hypothetical protein [Cytophagales bacterium]